MGLVFAFLMLGTLLLFTFIAAVVSIAASVAALIYPKDKKED